MIIGLLFIPKKKQRTKRKIIYLCDECEVIYYKKYQKSYYKKKINNFCSKRCMWDAKKAGGVTYEKTIDFFNSKESLNKRQKSIYKIYGVENVSQLEWVKEKKIETCLRHYGVKNPSQSKEILNKTKKTNLERYGVEHPLQSTDILNKLKKTNKEKYGFDFVLESPEIIKKSKQTLLNKYGFDHNMKIDFVKEKRKKTFIKNYGVEHPMKNKKISNKSRETFLQNYGETSPLKNKKVLYKMKQTNLERYGVEYIFQSEKIRNKINYFELSKKRHNTMKLKGLYKKSKKEDCFYNFLLNIFKPEEIERQKEINNWLIDFYILPLNLYIQFDGVYWHGKKLKERNKLTEREQVIFKTLLRDNKQNKWFKENNLNLFRITDEEFDIVIKYLL